jgi:hypothetical protein
MDCLLSRMPFQHAHSPYMRLSCPVRSVSVLWGWIEPDFRGRSCQSMVLDDFEALKEESGRRADYFCGRGLELSYGGGLSVRELMNVAPFCPC